MSAPVLCVRHLKDDSLLNIVQQYKAQLRQVAPDSSIEGSHFGEPEAGLVGNALVVRDDTPLHSALHELCHYICMSPDRRMDLHTDAGGDYDEENGVCFLQILLADHITNFGKKRMMQDMNSWGYTFRLGSAENWFEKDAEDAQQWLMQHQLINEDGQPTFRLRQ